MVAAYLDFRREAAWCMAACGSSFDRKGCRSATAEAGEGVAAEAGEGVAAEAGEGVAGEGVAAEAGEGVAVVPVAVGVVDTEDEVDGNGHAALQVPALCTRRRAARVGLEGEEVAEPVDGDEELGVVELAASAVASQCLASFVAAFSCRSA